MSDEDQPRLPFIPVVARTHDPETSHAAAADLQEDQPRLQRAVAAVSLLLEQHGPLTDFEIAPLWPNYWVGLFSESLPRKARRWACDAGLVVQDGFGTHQGRRVMRWARGRDLHPAGRERCSLCGRMLPIKRVCAT